MVVDPNHRIGNDLMQAKNSAVGKISAKKLKELIMLAEKKPKPKEVTIVVNGTPHKWEKNDEITYEEVAKLAFSNYLAAKTYSITYRRGQGNKPEGILPPGGKVKVKDGMIFNVSETSQS